MILWPVAPKTLTGDVKKRRAARHAMRAFERTSNTATLEYANDIQLDARESIWTAMWVPFTGDVAKSQSMIYEAWGTKKMPKTAAMIALGIVGSASVSSLRQLALGEDDEKEIGRAGLIRMAQELLSLIPGVGNILPQIAPRAHLRKSGSPAPELETPATAMLNTLADAYDNIAQAVDRIGDANKKGKLTSEELFLRSLLKLARAMGDAIGVPTQYGADAARAVTNYTDPKR